MEGEIGRKAVALLSLWGVCVLVGLCGHRPSLGGGEGRGGGRGGEKTPRKGGLTLTLQHIIYLRIEEEEEGG